MNITKYRNNTLVWYKGKFPYKYKVNVYSKTGKFKKTIQFGRLPYQQYKDTSPLKLYSDLDHLDPKRRKNYKKRHGNIKTKNGTLAYKIPLSPAWASWHFLW